MNSLNTVMLIGRLGKDPELHYSQKGTAILNMSIATDESYTDPQGASNELNGIRLYAFSALLKTALSI